MGGLTDVIESDLREIVGKVAPLLGTILGTPLAGVAVSLIAKAFDVPTNNIEDITRAVHADPESTHKLEKLEFNHEEILENIASFNYATEVEDRKDARQYGGLYKDFLRHMAYVVTFGFFCALFLLFLPMNIGVEEKNLLSMLVGMLASKWQTIIDFFFGSSRHNQGAIK